MSTIFGNRIKTIREEKQMPQRQLASALEIDTATFVVKIATFAKPETVVLHYHVYWKLV
jgi:transcriptional regulator with XRE-family HTH domain